MFKSKFKMISFFGCSSISISVHSFGILLFVASTYGGSDIDITNHNQILNDVQPQNRNVDFCTAMVTAKSALTQYDNDAYNRTCQLSDSCDTFSCDFHLQELSFSTRVNFNQCLSLSSVEYPTPTTTIGSIQLFTNGGMKTIPLKNGRTRESILLSKLNLTNGKQSHTLYLDLSVHIHANRKKSKSKSSSPSASEVALNFSLDSDLQLCSAVGEDCLNLPLLKLPYQLQLSTCEENVAVAKRKSKQRRLRFRRSPSTQEEMHRNDVGDSSRSRKLGEGCDLESFLSCGKGATCTREGNGKGICECLTDFEKNAATGLCDPRKSDTPSGDSDPPSPLVHDDTDSSSSGVTAILVIVSLILIATAVFLGTKYNALTHIRRRLPVSMSWRCWPFPPFRGNGRQRDNVRSFAYPIPLDDDDPPLLL